MPKGNHQLTITELSTGEKIRNAFEAGGQRQTRSRALIVSRLTELAAHQADFTAEGLWHDLRQADPHIGRATVYRAVDLLCHAGIVNRIDFADGSHCFRACGEAHHHHLTCIQCHQVIDIGLCLPEDQIAQIAQEYNFLVEGHSLTLFGLCAECQKTGQS